MHEGVRKGTPEYLGVAFAAQRHNIPPGGVDDDNGNTNLFTLVHEGKWRLLRYRERLW